MSRSSCIRRSLVAVSLRSFFSFLKLLRISSVSLGIVYYTPYVYELSEYDKGDDCYEY